MSALLKPISTLLLIGLLASSCRTPLKAQNGVPDISTSDYEKAISDKTKKIEVYDGLYNILTVQATWLDSKVADASLSQNARLQQWNEALYKEEREKRINKNAQSTDFFVSIYTPERKHSDLRRGTNLWKIYLEVDGQRYEGKASKVRLLLTEIQALYPYHNRWSTPYIVTFPVATGLIEGKNTTLTLTGAVGAAQLKYTPLN